MLIQAIRWISAIYHLEQIALTRKLRLLPSPCLKKGGERYVALSWLSPSKKYGERQVFVSWFFSFEYSQRIEPVTFDRVFRATSLCR